MSHGSSSSPGLFPAAPLAREPGTPGHRPASADTGGHRSPSRSRSNGRVSAALVHTSRYQSLPGPPRTRRLTRPCRTGVFLEAPYQRGPQNPGRPRAVNSGGLRPAPSSPRSLLLFQQPPPQVTSSPLEGGHIRRWGPVSLLVPECLLSDQSRLRPPSLEARGISWGHTRLQQLSPPVYSSSDRGACYRRVRGCSFFPQGGSGVCLL